MLKRGRKIVLLALLPLLAAFAAHAQDTQQSQTQDTQQNQTMFRPVAVVNDRAITGYDLLQRMKILSIMGASAASDEALQNAALDQLIEDRLKLQEGKRLGLTPTQELIDQAKADMAERMNVSPEELTALFSNQGVSELALNDMIGAEAVWREVIRSRFARRIDPTPAEIDAEMKIAANRGVTSYHLYEIGLPATAGGRSEADTRALADKLYSDLKAGNADFDELVRKYSRAPSAKRGGEVGWVPEANLPPELAAALAGVQGGGVLRPLTVPGGISILKVADTREEKKQGVDTDDPKLRERVRRKLINEQTARLSEGLLQELRRDAIIDIR